MAIKVNQLAKELKLKTKELIEIAEKRMNLKFTTSSNIDDADANLIRGFVTNNEAGAEAHTPKKRIRKRKKKEEPVSEVVETAEEKVVDSTEVTEKKVAEKQKEEVDKKVKDVPGTEISEKKKVKPEKDESIPKEEPETKTSKQEVKILSVAPQSSKNEQVDDINPKIDLSSDEKDDDEKIVTKIKESVKEKDDEKFHPRKRIVVKKKKKKKIEEEFFEDDIDIDLSKAVEIDLEDGKKKKKKKKKHVFIKSKKPKKVKIGESISIKELARQMGIKAIELYRKVKEVESEIDMEDNIDFDTVTVVLADYNVEYVREITDEKALLNIQDDKEDDLTPRPPIVTVMGHVDHGKTTLLDTIRKSKVADREAGGITQDIGASVVELKGKGKIVFIDTPGHEAFTSMRLRGTLVTDIVILVVAANDGVMPQTEESISHAKAANVPVVVAINKVDLPEANVDKVKKELSEKGLISEEWGGDTLMAEVSAKKNKGIDELLEMVLLQSELLELKANANKKAGGIIIRSSLDPHTGPVATTIVKNGKLKVKDIIVAGLVSGRVRALIDHNGKQVKEVLPSFPAEIMGFSGVPAEGEEFYVVKDDATAKKIIELRKNKLQNESKSEQTVLTLENFFELAQQSEISELNLILKAESTGAVDALKKGLGKFDNNEVRINIVHTGVGKITESDVTLAMASKAVIIGFNVRPDNNALRVAKKEKIEVFTSSIIYELIDTIKASLEGMLSPDSKEVINGRVDVRNTFTIPKVGTIAGGYVTDGFITRKDKVRVIRDGVVIYEGNVLSLKRFKDDASEVKSGYECGIGIEKFNDVKIGDILESFTFEDVKKTLE